MKVLFFTLSALLVSFSAHAERKADITCVDTVGTRYEIFLDNGDIFTSDAHGGQQSRIDTAYMSSISASRPADGYEYFDLNLNGLPFLLVKFVPRVGQGVAMTFPDNRTMGCLRDMPPGISF